VRKTGAIGLSPAYPPTPFFLCEGPLKASSDVFRRFDATKSYLVPDEYAETIQAQPDAKAGKTHQAGAGINLENIL